MLGRAQSDLIYLIAAAPQAIVPNGAVPLGCVLFAVTHAVVVKVTVSFFAVFNFYRAPVRAVHAPFPYCLPAVQISYF